jgi:hypothetical protein
MGPRDSEDVTAMGGVRLPDERTCQGGGNGGHRIVSMTGMPEHSPGCDDATTGAGKN